MKAVAVPLMTELVTATRRQSGLNAVPVKAASVSMEKGGKSISFGDKLLDYIEGGPKLRKWYGAPEEETPGMEEEELEGDGDEDEGSRNAVLVTDGDSDTGQMVVLSLIVKRYRVRVLVRDAKVARSAFGSYVEPIVGNVNDRGSVIKACKQVRAIICPTKLGALATKDSSMLKGIEHIVYVSELASSRKGLQSLFGLGSAQEAIKDETALAQLGIPYTILRPAWLRNEPGGLMGFVARKVDRSQDSSGIEGSMSREDAALLCVRALDSTPQQSLVLEVANAADSRARDIDAVFAVT